jgi:cytochrome c oxidase subunit 2
VTRLRPSLLLGVLALTCAACLPESGTAESNSVRWLYQVAMVAAALVFVIVWSWLTWNVIRYRARGRQKRPDAIEDPSLLPPQTRGRTVVEIIWTALPLATILALFVATVAVLNAIGAKSQANEPPNLGPSSVQITVIGARWGWTFQYAGGPTITGSGVPGPEVVVPADEPVRFDVTSQDVIHSFYVPRFLAKYDAIPGRTYPFAVTIAPGTYGGECAEFCGLLHAYMPFTIRAVPRPEFEAWIAQQSSAKPAPSSASPGSSASSPRSESP